MPPTGPVALSWSTLTPAALILGRSAERPSVDWAACAAAGVSVHRRASGGGPVLWDAALLSLDVVLPPSHPLVSTDVVATYRWLGETIADALRELGVPQVRVVGVAEAHAAEPGPPPGACFGSLSPFEVTAAGRKVVGLSQVRRRAGALLQAGIPLALDSAGLGRLVGAVSSAAFAAELSHRAAGLGELLPDARAGDVVAAVERAIMGRHGAQLEPDEPSPQERAVSARLGTGPFAALAAPEGALSAAHGQSARPVTDVRTPWPSGG